MQLDWTRRRWIKVCAGAGGAAVLPATGSQGQMVESSEKERNGRFPQQRPDLVRDTVGASHGNIERVRELVGAYPELAKSSWDWGFGDWESPIEAASHVGNREIAHYLIEHGARPNLFTFVMLGNLEVVKATLSAAPELLKATGPHSLSLMHHAKAGGDQAAAVRDYLRELGAEAGELVIASQEQAASLAGEFAAPSGPKLWIEPSKRGISVRCEDGPQRALYRLADGSWHPAGAASVRLRFEPSGEKAEFIHVAIGGASFVAARVR